MQATFFLLRRYLFPRSGSLLTFALWISVVGVALGIVQLMVVLSVMSGFQDLFRRNYTRISSELIVIPRGGREYQPAFAEKLRKVPGIRAITPTAIGQAMILKDGAVGGAVLEGVDARTSPDVTPWKEIWIERPRFDLQDQNPNWIWIGKQLADKLDAKPGDTVELLIADRESRTVIPFVVTAVTKFGIYDHDLRYARADLAVIQKLFHRADMEPIYKTKLDDIEDLPKVAEAVKEAFGSSASVRLWSEMNQNIFLAVQHQKKMLFLVLEIVVALAAVNVINLLMMSSQARRRDVAILRAMGMRFQSITTFFVLQGAAVGAAGIVVGLAAGYLVCQLMKVFQPRFLSESVYNVTYLPVRIELVDVSLVGVVGLVLCVLFSVIPAVGAALARPVTALRYE